MNQTASVKLARILSWIIAGILCLLPFHALLTTWLGSNTGHLDVVRIWKDVIIVLLLPFALWIAFANKSIKRWLLNSWVVRLFIVYALLHLALGMWAYSQHQVNKTALIYALIINLRFIYFFILCAVVAAASSFLMNNWRKIVLWPAAAVITFGLAQRLVLPHDFLKHFGYGPNTIPAYQTVDTNLDYQRIQSTLRGANPLGAYLVLVITAAVFIRRQAYRVIYILLGLAALFYSYSRSAWIGLAISLAIIAWWNLPKRHRYLLVVLPVVLVLGLGAVVYKERNNQKAQETLFHISSTSKSPTSSNEDRAAALENGFKSVMSQPQGNGPGTAGPASFRNNHPARIAENYYLQIGQEVGVIGAAIFIAINILVARELWFRRQDVLAQVLLASLAGISFINLLSHAWADDTLSLLWWGLAGIACAPVIISGRHKQNNAKKIQKTEA